MIAGCYDLHLYCDGVDCARGRYGEQAKSEYSGDETGAAARARARRAGWKIFRDGRCLCPGCKKAGVQLASEDGEPTIRPVTAEDVQKGGLAGFAVHVERATPVIVPGEWSSARRARVVRRVSRLMKPRVR